MKLSLVIPCFNSESYLEETLADLSLVFDSMSEPSEVIFVDDGSIDNSARIISGANDSRIQLITSQSNKGKYAALKAGIARSSGEYVVFTDADLPYGTEIIRVFFYFLTQNRYDVVVGDRTLQASRSTVSQSPARRAFSHFLAKVVSPLIFGKAFDTQCGIKGFKGDIARKLFPLVKENRFGGDLELLYLAKAAGMSVATHPVTLQKLSPSQVRMFQDGSLVLWMAIKLFIRRLRDIVRLNRSEKS